MPLKPNIRDYRTLEAFLEALIDWKLDRFFSTIDREWLRNLGVDPE